MAPNDFFIRAAPLGLLEEEEDDDDNDGNTESSNDTLIISYVIIRMDGFARQQISF
jgi:hypothetical protein